MHERYHSKDQINTAENAPGMMISHVGQSTVKTPHCDIQLKDVLHVPAASKNLVSVHRITLDNGVFIEFHPFFFLIKDQVTRRVLYRGKCVQGLYPLIPKFCKFNKQVHGAFKVSSERWHNRLGHPSFSIVYQILSKHKLPFVGEHDRETICDACQKAKSHQLPYYISTSVSTKPLQLIFFPMYGVQPPLPLVDTHIT